MLLCTPPERLFLSFMEQSPSTWADGVRGPLLRMGWFVVGVIALDMFSTVVRGRDREVLQVCPVDAGARGGYRTIRARSNLSHILVMALFLSPIAREGAVLLLGVRAA